MIFTVSDSIFLDASAVVAVLMNDADAVLLVSKISAARLRCYSAMSLTEAAIGLARAMTTKAHGKDAPVTAETLAIAYDEVKKFLSAIGAKDIAISAAIGKIAMEAALAYGRYGNHDAALNLGDCFAYACAKAHRLALLIKGDGFAHTDLKLA